MEVCSQTTYGADLTPLPDTIRRYMTYFLLERHEVCLDLLRNRNQSKRYHTCGVLKQGEHILDVYAGNFWWATVSWLKSRESVNVYDWNMNTRMEAEKMLLRPPIDHQVRYTRDRDGRDKFN